MTELKVGKEYWFKGKVTENESIYQYAPHTVKFEDWTSRMPASVEAVEVIPEREKVTIPKVVADFINGQKNLEHGVLEALEEAHFLTKLDVINWLKRVENQEKFLKAWIYGYEIEKEPLYTVEIPDPNRKGNNRIYLGKADNTGKVFINKGTFNPKKNKNLWLTESEIKEDFEWAWQFAVPVEE